MHASESHTHSATIVYYLKFFDHCLKTAGKIKRKQKNKSEQCAIDIITEGRKERVRSERHGIHP